MSVGHLSLSPRKIRRRKRLPLDRISPDAETVEYEKGGETGQISIRPENVVFLSGPEDDIKEWFFVLCVAHDRDNAVQKHTI